MTFSQNPVVPGLCHGPAVNWSAIVLRQQRSKFVNGPAANDRATVHHRAPRPKAREVGAKLGLHPGVATDPHQGNDREQQQDAGGCLDAPVGGGSGVVIRTLRCLMPDREGYDPPAPADDQPRQP